MIFERVFSCNKLHATGSVISYRSVHLDARKISPRCGMKCGGFGVCFFVQRVARYGSIISHGSVHLDARMISPRCGMKCGDCWVCFFVQQVARYEEHYSIS